MKKVMVLLMAVFLCSLSAWCYSSTTVTLGTIVVEENSLNSAKLIFKNHFMPLQIMPSGKYGYISEQPVLMVVVDATDEGEINEVDFLCGIDMWYEIEIPLNNTGYTFEEDGVATLGNGDTVPQKTYVKDKIVCLVQTIDKNIKQVIFKRK